MQIPNINGILFSAVDQDCKSMYLKDNIHFFPDEQSLRLWKFGKKNVIWLDDIANKKCEKCYGTGKLGMRLSSPLSKSDIIETLERNLLKEDDFTNDELSARLLQIYNIPKRFLEPMTLLIKMSRKDLNKDNLAETCKQYAEMIKNDFQYKEIIWCPCFMKNFQIAVNDIRRQIKFSIN